MSLEKEPVAATEQDDSEEAITLKPAPLTINDQLEQIKSSLKIETLTHRLAVILRLRSYCKRILKYAKERKTVEKLACERKEEYVALQSTPGSHASTLREVRTVAESFSKDVKELTAKISAIHALLQQLRSKEWANFQRSEIFVSEESENTENVQHIIRAARLENVVEEIKKLLKELETHNIDFNKI